jgi:hypothetical protein
LAHAWLSVRLFPSWNDLTSDKPVISVDHAIHIYHGYLGAKFLREHGSTWGYDPYFMAGYPKTPVYDSSSGPAELFQLLAGGVYSPRAYKIGVLCIVALVPVALALAALAYGLRVPTVFASVAWLVWYWWAGFADTLVRTGLVAFVWASALSVLVPAALFCWAQQPRLFYWVALCAAAALGIQAHSTFPIMAAAPLAIGYAWITVRRRGSEQTVRPSWRWHAATWTALGAALLLTSFWWGPLIKFLPLKTASDLFMTHRGNPIDSPIRRVAGLLLTYYLLSDAMVPLLLTLLGAIGLFHWCCQESKLRAAMVAAQILGLSILTFLGSEWQQTRNLEPLRFQVPLCLSLCLPAGAGTACVISHLVRWRDGCFWFLSGLYLIKSSNPWLAAHLPAGTWRGRLAWAAAAITFGLAALLTVPHLWWSRIGLNPALTPPSSWTSTMDRLRNSRPLAVGLRPEMNDLVNWIRQNTNQSARILFEDQLRLLERQDPGDPESIHWTPLLPLLTDRAYLGGLYHLAFIPHRRAAFGDWNLGGRPIRDWTESGLREFIEQYNIGWVITWSRQSPLKQGADRLMPLSTEMFQQVECCELVAKVPRHSTRPDEAEYTIFRVEREPSYFAAGSGNVVRADYNRIEVDDLRPDHGEAVLRFHWQDQLIAEPAVELRRSPQPGDPVGFIRILTDRPIERLVIRTGY